MKQLICCFIKVQPARSGPRHSQRPEKENFARSAPRGAKPVFVRLWRPNGVNFNGTAHLLFHQSSASPEWPETPRCAAKRNPSPQRTPGSEAGVCPPLADKRREPPFDGCVPSNECSASPEWLETLSAPRKEFPHRSASQGSEAGVCPPPAAKRRELQWNSSSAVPSKFSQPGVARDTSLRREKESLTAAHPGERSRCLSAFGGQTA